MVDPPDIGPYYLTLLQQADEPHFKAVTHDPSGDHGVPLARSAKATSRKSGLNLVPLLLALLCLLVPCVDSHALPSRAFYDDLDTLHPDVHLSRAQTDTSLLEKGLRLGEKQNNAVLGDKPYYHYVPSNAAPTISKRQASEGTGESTASTGEASKLPVGRKIAFAILVVILVLLSGVFAGLTLGYMSLDETQLQVLMTTGDDIQKARAAKIMPIRKDGHLLLTTLLIANMITNETLPIIFDPLLPNQVLSVVISTVLIVIFAELIPQSTCSRYGLQIGAYMAFPTRIIIITLWPVAYPVSRILHWVLGPHHGIVYRRAELKELVTMHAASGGRGGDLKGDTVMIVGGALDLQEKVVKQAMTPIDKVFMLPFTAKLDYPTLEKVVRTGHSRIPIYQEIEVQVGPAKSGSTTPKKKIPLLSNFTRKTSSAAGEDGKTSTLHTESKDSPGPADGEGTLRTVIRKKIVGTLLVKSCVLLDPEDAVPVSSMVINALPTVPADEPLLNVLNAFQEGRSHMAIVSPRSRKMLSEGTADLTSSKGNLHRNSQGTLLPPAASAAPRVDGLGDIDEEKNTEGATDVTRSNSDKPTSSSHSTHSSSKTRHSVSPKRKPLWSRALRKLGGDGGLEQIMPADATVSEKKVAEFELRKWESRQSQQTNSEVQEGLPLGIITLEDVLEEILGEEILDEYDDRGNEEQDFRSLIPPPSPEHGVARKLDGLDKAIEGGEKVVAGPDLNTVATSPLPNPAIAMSPLKKTMLTRLGITRQRSQREGGANSPALSQVAAFTDEPGSVDQALDASADAHASADLILSPSPIEGGGYFDDNRDFALPPSARSSSVPPLDRREAEEGRGRSSTRPATPTDPPLYSPQPSRAVVIRTQTPGGAPVTTIASEGMLRGRQQSLPSAVAASATRSQTPAGSSSGSGAVTAASGANKGNRFKSQAAIGVGAMPATLPMRSRSQAPNTSSPTDEYLPDVDREKKEAPSREDEE